jgi:RNA polymerase sigma-70 factor (ECF subfamily)
LLGRAEDAEDVLHDVFVAMQRLPSDGLHEPLHWLYRATTRACLNRLRNLRTHDRLRDTVALMERPPEQLSPEMATVLRQALAALPEELREVAVCAWLDRMTQAEIAEVIGCSRRTVSDHLARIRARLTSMEVEHGH